ncbi:hypothetical protein F5888DRAFT_1625523, partial [Russula emetica]
NSAIARFFAPSDLCGAGGMYQERIRCNPSWRDEYARYDTVFVQTGLGMVRFSSEPWFEPEPSRT